jgi:hypothetical protein
VGAHGGVVGRYGRGHLGLGLGLGLQLQLAIHFLKLRGVIQVIRTYAGSPSWGKGAG